MNIYIYCFGTINLIWKGISDCIFQNFRQDFFNLERRIVKIINCQIDSSKYCLRYS